MNMQLLFKIGEMTERSRQVGVEADSDEAKIKIGNFVQEVAAGRSGEDLSAEENTAWGEMGRRLHGTDRLPAIMADSVGLNRKATYADLFLTARLWTRM